MADRTYVFTVDEWWERCKTLRKVLGWPYTIQGMYQGKDGLMIVVDIWEQIADEEGLEEIRIWRLRHGIK